MEDNKKFCQTLITINSRDFPAAPIATTTTGADCWLGSGFYSPNQVHVQWQLFRQINWKFVIINHLVITPWQKTLDEIIQTSEGGPKIRISYQIGSRYLYRSGKKTIFASLSRPSAIVLYYYFTRSVQIQSKRTWRLYFQPINQKALFFKLKIK